jgi:DNA (cytosine-5)-methyltransferase 1
MREAKLMVRLLEAEKTLLDEAASAVGLPTASWARNLLLGTAKGRVPPHQPELLPQKVSLPLLSLFCGAGGLDQGFKDEGFTTVLAFDNDRDCVATFRHNHLEALTFNRSVPDLTLDELDAFYRAEFRPVGVIGGPPCQSFSVSNVHQRDDDPRHRLPEVYASLLKQLNARRAISFFLFENVPGLLSKRHLERYKKFKRLFTKAGFQVHEKLLNAKDYGVPQDRERIFVVGINQQLYPGKTWTPPAPQENVPTVRETIGHLPEPIHNDRALNPESFEIHPNHWCLVPRSQKFVSAKLEQGQAYGRSFRTLHWDEPSWTVAYGHREVHVHPNGKRRLSIYEAMLLQTFPPEYRLVGNMSAQVRLVSEAVPVRLARQIALSIRQSLGI